jgi:hypothetical protein
VGALRFFFALVLVWASVLLLGCALEKKVGFGICSYSLAGKANATGIN